MKTLRELIGIEILRTLDKPQYPDRFFHWLQFNDHIWEQFERHALSMAAKRKRYSARTIIEVMRWNSDLREQAAKPHPVSGRPIRPPLFKMSNNMTPGLARLWMVKHGKNHPKFFQLQK